MEHRTKRDRALINLVSEFETNFEKGNVEFLEEKSVFQLITFYEEERQFEKAIDVAAIALEQYKYRSELYIAMARLLLKSEQIDECLEYLNIAENIAPYENDIVFIKAKALAKSRQFDTAFALLNDLKDYVVNTDRVELLICEGEIYERMLDFSAMFDSHKEAIEIDQLNSYCLDKLWIATELSKRYEDCIAFMKHLINQNPYNSRAWFNLGHSHAFYGEYEEAIDALEYAFIIDPDFEDGYMDCADLCCQTKNFEKAEKIYKEVMAVFGEDSDLLINLAECQLYLNNITEAKENLYKSIKLDGHNDEAFFFLGECFSKEQKWYSAINAYHKGIEIEERSEDYYLGLAKAYIAVEDYNKATLNFQLCVSSGPEQTIYWREFTSFLIKLGLYEEALAILDEAEDFTFGADLLYSRALVNFFLKRKRKGLEILEEALLEDFSMHTFLFKLAPEFEVDKEIRSMINYFEGE